MKQKESEENVYTIEELDQNGQLTGHRFSFTGGKILPLSYEALEKQISNEPGKLSIVLENVRVIESAHKKVNQGSIISFNTDLSTNRSFNSFCLVEQGWLPLGLPIDVDAILLPDKSTISTIVHRFNPSKSGAHKSGDIIEFLREKPIRINPSLFAIEGNIRAALSDEEVEQQLDEAYDKITRTLPKAILFPKDQSGLEGVKGVLKESMIGFENKSKFLMEVAPMINGPISDRRKIRLWNEVLEISRKHDIRKDSILMLVVLSIISIPQCKSPAHGIIKPSQSYDKESAYNALSDLRALDIFMNMMSFFPHEKIVFCTNDKALALFWTGIHASNFIREGTHGRYTLRPIDKVIQTCDLDLFKDLTSP